MGALKTRDEYWNKWKKRICSGEWTEENKQAALFRAFALGFSLGRPGQGNKKQECEECSNHRFPQYLKRWPKWQEEQEEKEKGMMQLKFARYCPRCGRRR